MTSRTLFFPPHFPAAVLSVRAHGDTDWTLFAEARGAVAISSEKQVALSLKREAHTSLAELQCLQATDLHALDLGWVRLKDRDLDHILHFTHLLELDLDWTGISSQAVEHVNHFKHLKVLKLGHTRIDHQLVERLSVPVHHLKIRDTPMDDRAVAPLARLTQLQSLDIRKTAIGPQGVHHLHQQLPDCHIHF